MDQNEKSRWCVTGVQRDEQFHINTMAEIARQRIVFQGKVDVFRGEKVLVVSRADFEESVMGNDQVRKIMGLKGDFTFLDKLVVFRFKLENLRSLDMRPNVTPPQKVVDLRVV